jgi:peptidoglycan/LPS O-acetylase OafA/YrhL
MSAKHIPALDGVRGLAVLVVVLYHVGGGAHSSNPVLRTVATAFQLGWSGVTLFFVLSGFLITGILWDSKGAPRWYRNFYLRRTVRIFPLYYLALLIVLLFAVVAHHAKAVLGHLWVLVLYLQNMPAFSRVDYNFDPSVKLSHFWSLAVEEQFYLVWPFLISQMRTMRQVKVLALSLFLLSLVFRLAIWHWQGETILYNGFLLSRAGELALGAWLAMCWRDSSWHRVGPMLTRLSPVFLVAFLLTCLPGHSLHFEHGWTFTWGLFFITLFWGSVLATALRPGWVNGMFQMGWLRWIGGISYGLYVYHVLFSPLYLKLALWMVPSGNRNEVLGLDAALTILLSVLIAWVSFRFFERPILQLRTRFSAGGARR